VNNQVEINKTSTSSMSHYLSKYVINTLKEIDNFNLLDGEIKAEDIKSGNRIYALFSKYPMYGSLYKNSLKSRNMVNQFVNERRLVAANNMPLTISPVYTPSHLALQFAKFFSIPAKHIGAYLIGYDLYKGKDKEKQLREAQIEWVFSGILSGLIAVAVAFPTVTPFVVVGISVLGFVSGVRSLLKNVKENRELKKELENLNSIIRDMETLWEGLKEQLKKEKAQLFESILAADHNLKKINVKIKKYTARLNDKKNTPDAEEKEYIEDQLAQLNQQKAKIEKEMEYHADKVDVFIKEIKSHREDLKLLYTEKKQLEKSLQKNSTTERLDQTVALGLYALAVAAYATSIFVPPVGFGLLLASSVIGGAYTAGRLFASSEKNNKEAHSKLVAENSKMVKEDKITKSTASMLEQFKLKQPVEDKVEPIMKENAHKGDNDILLKTKEKIEKLFAEDTIGISMQNN